MSKIIADYNFGKVVTTHSADTFDGSDDSMGFSAVGVFTGNDIRIEKQISELTYTEKIHAAICIRFALGEEHVNVDAAKIALESLGYGKYEQMPMIWKTLAEVA